MSDLLYCYDPKLWEGVAIEVAALKAKIQAKTPPTEIVCPNSGCQKTNDTTAKCCWWCGGEFK